MPMANDLSRSSIDLKRTIKLPVRDVDEMNLPIDKKVMYFVKLSHSTLQYPSVSGPEVAPKAEGSHRQLLRVELREENGDPLHPAKQGEK